MDKELNICDNCDKLKDIVISYACDDCLGHKGNFCPTCGNKQFTCKICNKNTNSIKAKLCDWCKKPNDTIDECYCEGCDAYKGYLCPSCADRKHYCDKCEEYEDLD